MSSSGLRIIMAQLDFPVGAIDANADRVIDACRRARDEYAADAIVFPELCITGYPPEDLLLRPHFQEFVDRAVERVTHAVNGLVAIIGGLIFLIIVLSVMSKGRQTSDDEGTGINPVD